MGETEIPERDVGGLRGRDGEAVEQLRRDERQAEHDAEDLRGAHLLGDGPYDADRQQMEHGLADKPQELVHAAPELGDAGQTLGAVVEETDFADHITQAQNETAADECGVIGAKISPSTPMTRCRMFWLLLAASLTASLLTPSIPATSVNSL